MMGKKILNGLQFAVITLLLERDWFGYELYDVAKSEGYDGSSVAFYRLLMRLEDARFLKGENKKEVIDGRTVTVRSYSLLAEGRRAWDATRAYYSVQPVQVRVGFAGSY
jgi:DNA-binding PadR family transcriptional regulator